MATVKEAASYTIIQDYLVTMVTCMHVSMGVFSLHTSEQWEGVKTEVCCAGVSLRVLTLRGRRGLIMYF